MSIVLVIPPNIYPGGGELPCLLRSFSSVSAVIFRIVLLFLSPFSWSVVQFYL